MAVAVDGARSAADDVALQWQCVGASTSLMLTAADEKQFGAWFEALCSAVGALR